MPPRLPRVPISLFNRSVAYRSRQICLRCIDSLATRPTNRRRTSLSQLNNDRIHTRRQSSLPSASHVDISRPYDPREARERLREALLELQKLAGSYVNVSRLQLALRGLDQAPGKETIRIAVFGLQNNGTSLKTTKELIRALIADPLKEEEEWERILLGTGDTPLLLRIGEDGGGEVRPNLMVQELRISWPKMNEHNLEILVMGLNSQDARNSDDETILVPSMDIPTSSSGRYTPVTTPIHQAIVLGNGIIGAASLIDFTGNQGVFYPIANVAVAATEEKASLPFQVVDIKQAADAIQSFRQDVNKAINYEQGWFESGLAEITNWLKDGLTATDGSMKQPVRNLIRSVLNNALSAVDSERSARLTALLSAKLPSVERDKLRNGLSDWSERAHTELRDQLDIAFKGRRWRKLGWWKLFWRVDDVSMITSEILNQRFLTNAENEVIFLSGRFDQVFGDLPLIYNKDWAYKYVPQENGTGPPPPTIQGLIEDRNDDVPIRSEIKPWPLHIPATRTILAMESIPALQALAQKLVFQTLTTSTFSSALAGLIYVSTLTTSIYEAGAIAALGIVWSLRRMQGKWETARKFWEGEVNEEGRKAVRETEKLMTTVLSQTGAPLEGAMERDIAFEAIDRAEIALESCK
jgi:hypothetical protein